MFLEGLDPQNWESLTAVPEKTKTKDIDHRDGDETEFFEFKKLTWCDFYHAGFFERRLFIIDVTDVVLTVDTSGLVREFDFEGNSIWDDVSHIVPTENSEILAFEKIKIETPETLIATIFGFKMVPAKLRNKEFAILFDFDSETSEILGVLPQSLNVEAIRRWNSQGQYYEGLEHELDIVEVYLPKHFKNSVTIQ